MNVDRVRQEDLNNNRSIIVNNIGGTSSEYYQIDGLYDKWRAVQNYDPVYCQVKGCKSAPTATAHVRKQDGRRDNNWWLTRFCHFHNHPSRGPMPLRKNAKLVSVREITGT